MIPISILPQRSPKFFVSCLFNPTMASGGEGSKKLQLYSASRSSCCWRVRIALNFKGLEYEYKPVSMLKNEHHSPEFLRLNPLGYLPVLVDGDAVVSDSLAIILYLEEKFPQNPLLPRDLQKRALTYQAANIVCSSIQPLQNISIINNIREKFGPHEVRPWALQHIRKGFTALEKLLKDHSGKYATGDEVSLVDVCLAPQIDGAVRRFQLDMNEFPLLKRINEAYVELPAFQAAVPQRQPDADL